MPALNVPKLLIDTLWTTLEARTDFTTAIGAGVRVKTADIDYFDRAAGSANAGKYPQVFIFQPVGTEPPVVPVFGYGLATTTVDHGIKATVTFDVRIVFEFMDDANVMPVEAAINAALHKYPIDLRALYRWAGVVTPLRHVRTNTIFGGKQRTMTTWTISADTSPYLSALIAT